MYSLQLSISLHKGWRLLPIKVYMYMCTCIFIYIHLYSNIVRCSRKIPLDLIAASWDSGQKQHQHTGSLVTGERWSQVANTFTGKHFVMILNSMPTFFEERLVRAVARSSGAAEKDCECTCIHHQANSVVCVSHCAASQQ